MKKMKKTKKVNWLLLTRNEADKPVALQGSAECRNVDQLCKLVSKHDTIAEANVTVLSAELTVYRASEDELDRSFVEKELVISNTESMDRTDKLIEKQYYILQVPSEPKLG